LERGSISPELQEKRREVKKCVRGGVKEVGESLLQGVGLGLLDESVEIDEEGGSHATGGGRGNGSQGTVVWSTGNGGYQKEREREIRIRRSENHQVKEGSEVKEGEQGGEEEEEEGERLTGAMDGRGVGD